MTLRTTRHYLLHQGVHSTPHTHTHTHTYTHTLRNQDSTHCSAHPMHLFTLNTKWIHGTPRTMYALSWPPNCSNRNGGTLTPITNSAPLQSSRTAIKCPHTKLNQHIPLRFNVACTHTDLLKHLIIAYSCTQLQTHS
jgi:hypothetical protein